MGSTMVSKPLVQTDDLSLIQSLTSALNQRKMSTSMGTVNRRKQTHSNIWMNVEDFGTMSVSQSSSASSSPSSDMTLPTPPRSPNGNMGFEETMQEYEEEDEEEYTTTNDIPEPLLDDLLELWCEEADFTAEENEEISIHNALTELGFDSLVSNSDGQNENSMSETEHAESMIDHLLATCKASYLSPPPTNPSSPKMQTDIEFEESFMVSSIKSEVPEPENEGIETEIISEDYEATYVKDEVDEEGSVGEPESEMILPHSQNEDEMIQSFICDEELMNYQLDEHLLLDSFDDTNQIPGMSDETNIINNDSEKLIETFKDEPIETECGMDDQIDDDYQLFGEPKSKKGRYDFEDEFLTDIPDIKQDCMWNGFFSNDLSSPNMGLGGGNWKQEYTFETLFEEKDKMEEPVVPGAVAQVVVSSVSAAEEKLRAAQKEAEAAAAAAVAAEEAEKKRKLEHFKIAFDNDHRYALAYDDRYHREKDSAAKIKTASSQQRKVIQGIIVKSETPADKVGSATPKKTKILVPLKDLMETLQQKSFLVSPLGPNKKIIRFTGADSVKGVLSTASFQSAAFVAGQCSTVNSRTISTTPSKPNHNVRKRPHTLKSPKIEITPTLSPMEMSPSSSPLLSSSILSPSSISSHGSSSQSSSSSSTAGGPPTKKKTKAHNNMERMRRIDLRNSFENLKKLVPPLAKIPKCSKVEILRRAEEYIKGLRNQEKRLQKEEMQVRQRNAQLRSRLESTNSSLNSSSLLSSSCN